MSDHDLQTTVIKIVAKRLRSTPELVQLAIMSEHCVALTMFNQILDDMRGRLI